jgi:hypothetical protein
MAMGMTGIWLRKRPRLRGRSAHQLATRQNGDSDSLPVSYAPGMPGAPLIPLVNSAFRILAVDLPGTALDAALLRAWRGFVRALRALPRGDTWPHAVEMPIRFMQFHFHLITRFEGEKADRA